MTAQDTTDELLHIASADDFAARLNSVTDAWTAEGAGAETVDPVLRFMEEHPGTEFGSPGALVQYLERFYGFGYEEKLIDSVKRIPAVHTVSMLNRLISRTLARDAKRRLVAVMECALLNPRTDNCAVQQVNRFLARIADRAN